MSAEDYKRSFGFALVSLTINALLFSTIVYFLNIGAGQLNVLTLVPLLLAGPTAGIFLTHNFVFAIFLILLYPAVSLLAVPIYLTMVIFFSLAALFITGGLAFILARTVFGGEAGYEETMSVFRYASVTSVVSWIPGVAVVAAIYSLYISIVGLASAQKINKPAAFVCVLVASLPVLLINTIVVGVLLITATI